MYLHAPPHGGAAPPAEIGRCRRRRTDARPTVGSISRSTAAPDRGLAAAGFADEPDDLAAPDLEGDVVAAPAPAARGESAGAECFARSRDAEQRRGHRQHLLPADAAAAMPRLDLRRAPAPRRGRPATARGSAARRRSRAAWQQARHGAGNGGQRAAGPLAVAARRPAAASRRAGRWCRDGGGGAKTSPTGALLDDAPGIHHRDAVADFGDDAEIVGDEQDAHAALALQALQQVEDLGLDGDVERRRRLVGDQQRRVAGQRHGDHGALAHAARQFVRILAGAARRHRGCRRWSSRSTAAVHAAACRLAPRCSRIGSAIWSPTVKTGLRLVIGSWKTMPISSPRMRRSSPASRVARSTRAARPGRANCIAPAAIRRACAAAGRMIDRLVTDLPGPGFADQRQRSRRRRRSRSTSSTAVDLAAADAEHRAQALDVEHGSAAVHRRSARAGRLRAGSSSTRAALGSRSAHAAGAP